MTARETGDEDQPRRLALVLSGRSGEYVGRVTPTCRGDDGMRDFYEDMIEGLASREERAGFSA
jgi:hypothetical protein